MLTMGVAVQVVSDWVQDPGKIVDYGVRFTKPVFVDASEGSVVVVTGKVGTIDLETNLVRIDLSVVFNETSVLGKAQAVVRL
jgi:acyl dehydratase